jgi:hypothetical protein
MSKSSTGRSPAAKSDFPAVADDTKDWERTGGEESAGEPRVVAECDHGVRDGPHQKKNVEE